MTTTNDFKFTFSGNHKAELIAYVERIIETTKAQVQAKRDYVKTHLDIARTQLTETTDPYDQHIEDINDEADEKFRNTLANRQLRMQIVEDLTECYREAAGDWPDGLVLERLTNAILEEELYSDDNYYVKHTEYPILNERKYESRTRKDVKSEGLETVDTGGKNQRKPTKRKRGKYENAFIDKHTRGKNRERRKKYQEFTKVQPVKRWNMHTGEVYE